MARRVRARGWLFWVLGAVCLGLVVGFRVWVRRWVVWSEEMWGRSVAARP